MDLVLQSKINKAKLFLGLPQYDQWIENIINIFKNVKEINLGTDNEEKYIEFVFQNLLDNPTYFIKYKDELINKENFKF